jgi:hypothetical protein
MNDIHTARRCECIYRDLQPTEKGLVIPRNACLSKFDSENLKVLHNFRRQARSSRRSGVYLLYRQLGIISMWYIRSRSLLLGDRYTEIMTEPLLIIYLMSSIANTV